MEPRHRAILLIALTAAATLLGGFGWKYRCVEADLEPYETFWSYCYTDHVPLFHSDERGWAEDKIPYVEGFNEYPVVTGAYHWLTALFASDATSFFVIGSMGLIALGFLVTALLFRHAPSWPKVLGWTATPPLFFYTTHNWDLLAVAFCVAGWIMWRKDDAFTAALLFGLGGAAKLYPAFFLPFLGLALLRRRDWRDLGRGVAGGTLGLAVPNLIVYAWAPEGWLDTWRFHAERAIHWETLWDAVRDMPGADEASRVVPLALMAIGLAALAWAQWRGRVDTLTAGTLLTVLFLVVNRVYSPQYVLWILPILVLMNVPWSALGAVVAVDTAEHLLVFQMLTPQELRWAWLPPDLDGWLMAVVVARNAAFAWAAWTVWQRRRTRGSGDAGPVADASQDGAAGAGKAVDSGFKAPFPRTRTVG
jgi:hypothetical protein